MKTGLKIAANAAFSVIVAGTAIHGLGSETVGAAGKTIVVAASGAAIWAVWKFFPVK